MIDKQDSCQGDILAIVIARHWRTQSPTTPQWSRGTALGWSSIHPIVLNHMLPLLPKPRFGTRSKGMRLVDWSSNNGMRLPIFGHGWEPIQCWAMQTFLYIAGKKFTTPPKACGIHLRVLLRSNAGTLCHMRTEMRTTTDTHTHTHTHTLSLLLHAETHTSTHTNQMEIRRDAKIGLQTAWLSQEDSHTSSKYTPA